MSGQHEDDAWRAIVDNYGERPQVDDLPAPDPAPEPNDSSYDDLDARLEEAERFVPPVPPPGPRLTFPRHLPWVGLFGSPLVLLVSLLAGVYVPAWLGYLLVAAFVGSFVYLVLTMARGPRPPWDDGARV